MSNRIFPPFLSLFMVRFLVAFLLIGCVQSAFAQSNILKPVLPGNDAFKLSIKLDETESEDSILLSPDDYQGRIDQALALVEEEKYQKAIQVLHEAKAIYQEAIGERKAGMTAMQYDNPDPDHLIANIYQVREMPDSAKHFYFAALEIAPYSVGVLNDLSIMYIEEDKADSAVHYLNKALKVNEKSSTTNHNLGLAKYLTKDPKKAREFLNRSLELDSTALNTYQLLGLIEEDRGRIAKAKEAYTNAIIKNPESPDALIARGTFFLRRERVKNATNDFKAVIQLDPDHSAGQTLAALMDIIEGRHQEGAVRLSRAIFNNADFTENFEEYIDNNKDIEISELMKGIAEGKFVTEEAALFGLMFKESLIKNGYLETRRKAKRMVKGNIKREMAMRVLLLISDSKGEELIDEMDQVLDLYDPPAVYQRKGYYLFQKSEFERSIKAYDKCLKENPNHTIAHYYKALSQSHLEQFDEAIGSLNKAVALVEDYSNAINERGDIHYTQGATELAKEDYRLSFSHSNGDGKALHNLAVIFHEQGQLDSALYYYERACDVNYSDILHRKNRGQLKFEMGDYASAIGDLKYIANWSGSTNTEVMFQLALSYVATDSLFTAKNMYEKLISINDTIATYHAGIGDVDQLYGNPQFAKGHYERAIELDPSYQYAHLKLGHMLVAERQFDDAKKSYETALAIDSTNYKVFLALGEMQQLMKRPKQALSHLKEANQITETAETYTLMSEIYFEQANYDSALFSASTALRFDGRYAPAYRSMAKLWWQLGKYKQCIKFTKLALLIEPDDYDTMFLQGLANLQIGAVEESLSLCQKSVEIAGEKESEPLKEKLLALANTDELGENVEMVLKQVFE